MAHRIALVGIGKIARDQHVPSIADSSAFELAATASRSASIDGITAYTSLADLLAAEPEIPCISLCTPPQARYADARRALVAGRHVMLEKPPGATLSEVHDLEALARDKGVALLATWHSREAAAVAAARDWLSQRTLREVRISWKEDVREWHPGQDWIWEPGGLGVFDPGINALSIMTAILPRAVHLSSAEISFPANRQTPIAADLEFSDAGGAALSASFDWRATGDPEWNIDLATDGATARLSDGGARFEVDGEEIASGPDREYPRLYERFAECVKDGIVDVDLSPMRHVADAFTLGKRIPVDPFEW